MGMITYTDPLVVLGVQYDKRAPSYGRNADGYGRKIPTNKKVKYLGRWRRVYVVCFSNSGSAYIVVRGKSLYLDTDTKYRLSN
jgi:hypothetical protein